MNVLPETDKQVGAILEAIRDVSPEVIEQAVMYHRICYSVWLVVLIPFIGVLIWLARYCAKRWDESDGYSISAVILGIVVFGFSVGYIGTACRLAKTYYAPDYFAAECMIKLGRAGLGR